MKIFRLILIAAVIAIVPFCKSFAQKSIYNYVINNHNDTIKCEIITTLFGKVKYQPVTATDDKYIRVKPAEIKEYYVAKDSSTYVPVTLPGSTDAEYLKLVERGRINLYEKITQTYSQYGNGSTNYYWYVSKGNSPLKELKSNTMFNDGSRKDRKGIFMDMISDDAPLLAEFTSEDKFSFDKLQYYVQKYNDDQLNNAKSRSK
ncbi:MAG: hypothetical protein ACXVJN_19390 [Mucilaginibacter sp.]